MQYEKLQNHDNIQCFNATFYIIAIDFSCVNFILSTKIKRTSCPVCKERQEQGQGKQQLSHR